MILLDALPVAVFGAAFYGALVGAGHVWRKFRAPSVPMELDEAARVMGLAFAREATAAIGKVIRDEMAELFDALRRERAEQATLIRRLHSAIDAINREKP